MSVTVLTATWDRADLLIGRCMPAAAAQTMPVEHMVISDRPNPRLRERLTGVTYVESATAEHPPRTSSTAINYGAALATTDYVAVCDDDNALRPKHCELLSMALEESGADFAYSQIFRHGIGDVIGQDPPTLGQVDGNALMWRRDAPRRYGWWDTEHKRWPDWLLVQAWMAAGATYVFVPEVTVDYYWSPRSWSHR